MEPTKDMVKYAISHLEKQDLWGKEALPVPNLYFPVPELRGQTIEDHFYNIGKLDSDVYHNLALSFSQLPVHGPPPKKWILQEGWTRYGKDGSITRVEYPKEKMLTFDVETVPNLSKYPVMACAYSSEAWYGWVSPWLINPVTKGGRQNDAHLLTFGPSRNNHAGDERILVGHNVGYDRARILEEYCLEQNGMRYLDTMSLHIAGSGLCTQQRPSWLKYSKAIENGDTAYLDNYKDTTGKYFDVSAVNSLLQVSKFHCGINMDKAPRDLFIEATDIGLIQENFQELMTYCGKDVVATHAVYKHAFPRYLETCPHPVSFAGILQMGSSFLTVNEGWTAYIARCNKMYKEMAENVESKLMSLAHNALDSYEKDPEFYKHDPWLSQLDWSFPKGKARILPGKPQWYRGLWDPEEKRIKLTTRQRVAPLLLKLQWYGFPLIYSKLYGWTFRVPQENEYTTKVAQLTFPAEGEAGYQESFSSKDFRYYRLPHKSGEGVNVGNPLSKGYVGYFDDNVLSSFAGNEGTAAEDSKNNSTLLARQALDMNAQCAYWVSARERIEDQFVVWDKGSNGLGERMRLPEREGTSENKANGIILPQIITMGTVTRRAVEKTWMTASNAKKNRIGSELKSMVEAPAGYKIVGADVDSEELWISSLMGDAQFRMHGATALGWMTLQGTKAAGTDLHSKTAQILGISRDQAKIFNYGRIYGAGVKFAARLMQQFNSAIDAAEAKQRATNLYTATKGLKQQKAQDYELVHDRPFWHGGTESYMFNSLERTATADDPRTPTLNCGITDALKPKHTETQFMTSRVNWVVQSSGVDYLHMLLVSMNYLIKKYDIKARFMLCVHDEVRYMVKEEDSARATLALQISNLWTRAMFSYKLGIHDLPQSVAFFSSVDVDHVLRKEVNMDCLTPTQPHPIPHGQSLTIDDVLGLTNGGDLGPVVPGFVDAAEDPIPFSLLSKDQQQYIQQQRSQQESPIIQEITETDVNADSVVQHAVKSATEMTEERNSIFLEAQSLGSLREIKQAIKRRRAEAEAEYQARVAAERKRLEDEERASRRGNDSDGNNDGQGTEALRSTKRKSTKSNTTKTPRGKKRLVREAAPFSASRVITTSGAWGVVQTDNSELEAELIDDTQYSISPQQSTMRSGKVDAEQLTLPEIEKMSQSEDEMIPVIDNGLSDIIESACFEDPIPEYDTDKTSSVSLDDDWTLPTEEWHYHFTKDYGPPNDILYSSTDPFHGSVDSLGRGYEFESSHLPYIIQSGAEKVFQASPVIQDPTSSIFLAESLPSYVSAQRINRDVNYSRPRTPRSTLAGASQSESSKPRSTQATPLSGQQMNTGISTTIIIPADSTTSSAPTRTATSSRPTVMTGRQTHSVANKSSQQRQFYYYQAQQKLRNTYLDTETMRSSSTPRPGTTFRQSGYSHTEIVERVDKKDSSRQEEKSTRSTSGHILRTSPSASPSSTSTSSSSSSGSAGKK
ncbi:DNA-directed DNA polymerase gamma mip1 [Linnemannia zychae]|nr:DNA-directed DNA polymerase gamma mip1 [Linnemannia zychae]